MHVGDAYNEPSVDRALKSLFATGLFSDVKINLDGSTLTIHVVENPIINQVVFEGNEQGHDQGPARRKFNFKPRLVFTRAKVQSDVQRIIELYRRNGKFAASVDPQIIQRPQNRVDLIFSINEGPTTGVARIIFIGNKFTTTIRCADRLPPKKVGLVAVPCDQRQLRSRPPTFDREQLRRFYVSHGYADFHVVSAVAELTPDRSSFYITFTVDEGPRYNFGKIDHQFEGQGNARASAAPAGQDLRR